MKTVQKYTQQLTLFNTLACKFYIGSSLIATSKNVFLVIMNVLNYSLVLNVMTV